MFYSATDYARGVRVDVAIVDSHANDEFIMRVVYPQVSREIYIVDTFKIRQEIEGTVT